MFFRLIIGMVLTIFCCSLCGAGEPANTVHVFVALADNKHQGIVPVPAKLGNGNDPFNNLYWGALYGVKAYLKRGGEWKLVSTEKNPANGVLERCVFYNKPYNTVLIADAYKGTMIRQALTDFFRSVNGENSTETKVGSNMVRLYGGAGLLVYIGHNGLMDFKLANPKVNKVKLRKDAIVLCCKSRQYFAERLKSMGCRPVLLTTGFMAPEAYTLQAALKGWLESKNARDIREMAAKAYNKYQKCGLKNARRLFYSE